MTNGMLRISSYMVACGLTPRQTRVGTTQHPNSNPFCFRRCRVMTDALLKAQADAQRAIQLRQNEVQAIERLTLENQMLAEQLRRAGIVDDDHGIPVKCCGVNPKCVVS
eukprot:scaffold576_cov260-Pinguiococcus_pyrenoidosus.AAC.83